MSTWRRRLFWTWLLGALCSSMAWASGPAHLSRAELWSVAGRGFTPAPYKLDPTDLLGPWESVDLPHALVRPLLPAPDNDPSTGPPTVTSWYRVAVPESMTSSPLGLYIPRWKTDGQLSVYGDSRLLYQSHADPYWNGWNIPLWIPLHATRHTQTPHFLYLRVQRTRDSGGGISSLWVGSDSELNWRFQTRHFLQVQLPYVSSVAFLAVGLFALSVWLRQRPHREPLYLLFFLMALASFLRTFHYHVGEHPLLLPGEWFGWLTVNSLFWLITNVHFFLNHLHGRRLPWLDRLVVILTLGVSAASMPLFQSLSGVYLPSPLAYVFLMIMGVAVGIVGFILSRRGASSEGVWLSGWCLLGMVLWIYDWMLQRNLTNIEGVYLGPYTNFAAALLFLTILFRRYMGAINVAQQLNDSLAQRLQQREQDLARIHEQKRLAERRQTLADERQRMMQDMHDGMGSSLRSALLAVEAGQTSPSQVADVLKDCIDDLMLAIDAIEPLESDLLLLLATLRFRLGPRLEGAGMTLRWDINDVPPLHWLDHRNALHVLRILQEAFTNIIRHARATQIRASTTIIPDWVLVTLTDNGDGFDVNQSLSQGGKGLNNQLRRAAAIGARIEWYSDTKGTRMVLHLPITRH